MSLDDLNELVRLTNKIKGKVPFDQLKNSLTSGPFITAPYNSALYQIICAIDEVETMATKQIESDLQAFSNGWENEMPLGVIPHEVGNSNW